VVVRHAWHGGALRRVTRDLFAPPTRAPHELRTSERLRAAGVRTPAVVAYARYPAPLGLRRVDVATAFVPDARDLAAVLLPDADDATAARLRPAWLDATAALLGTLARAGARHPDLNLKNVLLAADPAVPHAHGGAVRAWVLDVDVAALPSRPATAREAEDALAANLARLRRSLDKWRRTRALPVDDAELAALAQRARAHLVGAVVVDAA
jgi:3-deoxy-D-manno-octulosonic acid kinase